MSARYEPARIRSRIQVVRLERFYRLVRDVHETSPLGAVPKPSRFSDPAAGYSVLYAAETLECAFWEAIGRGRFTHRKRWWLPYAVVAATRIVSLSSTKALELVDLRGDGPIRIGAPTAVVHDANHAAGRTLSAAVYHDVPEADGFLFSSRFTGKACVAVFDRALTKLRSVSVQTLMEDAEFLRALDDYDITIIDADA